VSVPASTAAGRAAPRACMLSFYFEPSYSGSAIQARNLSRYLMRRGIEVQVVSANLTGSPEREVMDGITVWRLPVSKNPKWQVPSFLFRLAWFLFRHRKSYDVVHAHGTFQHVTASLVARLSGKKSLLKVAMANSDIAFQRQGRLWSRFNRFLVSRFDEFIATSKIVEQEFADHGFARERVNAIPNGVDTEVYRPCDSVAEKRALRARLGLTDRPTICFVGIVIARKNVDFALRVWRAVHARGIDGQLVIVGPLPGRTDVGDQRYYESLREYVEREGLTGKVVFTDLQKDVVSYLRASDAFLFPSRQEGMPNALLEAMAVALPCIASKISGTEDLLQQGRTGYLYPLDDEAAFAECLAGVLTNRAEAQRVGSAAREFIQKSYSLDSISARYDVLYRRLLSN
jgi:glycosyltransferase involved in cell wall biosynthesis